MKPGVGVEKGSVESILFSSFRVALVARLLLTGVQLSGRRQGRHRWLAEEPYQSLDVLGRCRQEELLPHELQSPQAQAT